MEDWVHIIDWQESGEVTPLILEKWALMENGYFTDQDEDLLMFKVDLIWPMHNLMLNPDCKRQIDLLKTLKNYAEYVFTITKNKAAQVEFNKIELIMNNSNNHLDLVNHLKKIKSR